MYTGEKKMKQNGRRHIYYYQRAASLRARARELRQKRFEQIIAHLFFFDECERICLRCEYLR